MIKNGTHILFTILVFFGCQSGVEKELKAELQESENKLEVADKTIEECETQLKSLVQKHQEAKLKNENLKIRTNEINEWAENVVKKIGPCVWGEGLFERPVPQEIVRNGSPSDLIQKLNEKFKTTNSPEAKLVKVEDGTAFIKISDDEKLTQGMGTLGAANYLNSITYTLWSIEEIKCVDIDFEGGDHAYPTKDCIGT